MCVCVGGWGRNVWGDTSMRVWGDRIGKRRTGRPIERKKSRRRMRDRDSEGSTER